MTAYDDEYSTCAETYATLLIYHDALDPDLLSERLGLMPTRSQKKGDILHPHGIRPVPAPIGGWFLSTREILKSKDCRRHIDYLLEKLAGKEDVFRSLRADGYRTIMSCYWLSAHGHGGPMVAAQSLSRMGELGLDLEFAVQYWPNSEEQDEQRPDNIV